MTHAEYQRAEVMWYGRHGQYPERIKRDGDGNPYVAGDWSWHRQGHPIEYVDRAMELSICRAGG